jgi:hypothetical protein
MHEDELRASAGDARRHARRRSLQLPKQRDRGRPNPLRVSAAVAVRQIVLQERASRGDRRPRLAWGDRRRVPRFAFALRGARWRRRGRQRWRCRRTGAARMAGGAHRRPGRRLSSDRGRAGWSLGLCIAPDGGTRIAQRQEAGDPQEHQRGARNGELSPGVGHNRCLRALIHDGVLTRVVAVRYPSAPPTSHRHDPPQVEGAARRPADRDSERLLVADALAAPIARSGNQPIARGIPLAAVRKRHGRQ